MNKQNKGITLIALVITIVVLVILVGVSLSVAINTGLLKNSKTAVSNYDKAQQDEKSKLDIIAGDMEFNYSGKELGDYIYNNGMITGVRPNTTAATFREVIGNEYELYSEAGNKITDNNVIITTGTSVRKGTTTELARVVIYGDVDSNGSIDGSDGHIILKLADGVINKDELENYEIIAADVNNDKEINEYDSIIATAISVNILNSNYVEQKVEAKLSEELDIVPTEVSRKGAIDKYIENLPSDFKNNIELEWLSQGHYLIYVEKDSIDAETFINYLENDTAAIYDLVYNEDDEVDEEVEINSKDYIEADDFLKMKLYGSDWYEATCIIFKIK